jgi:hypothetical protein
VDRPDKPSPALISLARRIALAVAALVLCGLLATAASLKPDARGYGTHQQLGLPPCTFYVIFHKPCPSCGMTTSWAWLLRGEIGHALSANAGGALLAVLSLVAAPWMLISAARGRWCGGPPNDWTVAGFIGTVTLVIVGQWVWRLWMN